MGGKPRAPLETELEQSVQVRVARQGILQLRRGDGGWLWGHVIVRGTWEEQGSCVPRVRAETLEPVSAPWLSPFLKCSHNVLFEKQTPVNAGKVGLTQTAFRPASLPGAQRRWAKWGCGRGGALWLRSPA